MAQVKLTLGVIFIVLAVVLIGISTAISGILSTKFPPGQDKNKLLAISAISGLSVIIGVIAAIFGILFARAKRNDAKNKTTLLVLFIIFIVIAAGMYITVVILTLSMRAQPGLNSTDKNALTASLILTGFGFIFMAASAIMFFTITKELKGKEAWRELRFRKRGDVSYSPGSGSTQSWQTGSADEKTRTF